MLTSSTFNTRSQKRQGMFFSLFVCLFLFCLFCIFCFCLFFVLYCIVCLFKKKFKTRFYDYFRSGVKSLAPFVITFVIYNVLL